MPFPSARRPALVEFVVAHDVMKRARGRVARSICLGRTAHTVRHSSARPRADRQRLKGKSSREPTVGRNCRRIPGWRWQFLQVLWTVLPGLGIQARTEALASLVRRKPRRRIGIQRVVRA